ncbi:MAG TPA: amino acid transporter [Microbacterium sp.]|nr:amino acid transporter [Microbacterium sp.]
MTEKNTTRRDLMKPVHLLGWSFVAALFAGFVTAMAMGAFTEAGGDIVQSAWRVAAIVAGVTFIVVVLSLALLLLAVDPRDVDKQHNTGVLLPEEQDKDSE